MITASEAYRQVAEATESTELQDTRFLDTIEVGEFARQGDLYIERIKTMPKGCKLTTDKQLAPGTTQGSRHVVEGAEVMRHPQQGQIERRGAKHYCYGPVIEAKDYATVTHPEHAHISIPAGIYQISYQVDTQQMRRVAD